MITATPDAFANEPMVIAGRKIDGRTIEARRFRTLAFDPSQFQRTPTPAERLLFVNAATLATLCERFTADLLEGSRWRKSPTAAT